MKDYMAPMEGITNYIYRKAYHDFYRPMDKYFTPFLSAKPNKRLSAKEIREISPENNKGMYLVPQILAGSGDDFVQLARLLKEEYGYQEVNLNLGCPSGTVAAKGKGAGFLGDPQRLDAFLDQIFSSLDMKISIKTRIGTDYEEDWEYLLKIYEKYPIHELIIHPRLLSDYYKNTPRLPAFLKAQECLSMPLCYNGNLFSKEDYKKVKNALPGADIFMYGRGLIANPGLTRHIREGKAGDKENLKRFCQRLYQDYQQTLFGEKNVLFRMKELWSYMALTFTNYEKYRKKIKKSQSFLEYQAAVQSLFAEQELLQEVSLEKKL